MIRVIKLLIFICLFWINIPVYSYIQDYRSQIDIVRNIESSQQGGIVFGIPLGKDTEVYKQIDKQEGYNVSNTTTTYGGASEDSTVSGLTIDYNLYEQISSDLLSGELSSNQFGGPITNDQEIPILINNEGFYDDYEVGDKIDFADYKLPTPSNLDGEELALEPYNGEPRTFKVVGIYNHVVNNKLNQLLAFPPDYVSNYLIPYVISANEFTNPADITSARHGDAVFLPNQQMQVVVDRSSVSGPAISEFENELSDNYNAQIGFMFASDEIKSQAKFQLSLNSQNMFITLLIDLLLFVITLSLLNIDYLNKKQIVVVSNLLGESKLVMIINQLMVDLCLTELAILFITLVLNVNWGYTLLLLGIIGLWTIICHLLLAFVHFRNIGVADIKGVG